MDTIQLQTTHPVTSRFADMAPDAYQGEIDRLWRAAEAYEAQLQQQVEAEIVSPRQAVGLLATHVSQLFGAHELTTPIAGS